MARAFKPKIVSANDLMEGDVVYFAREGGWTRSLAEAAVAETEARAEALLASAAAEQHVVVGPYLADVALTPGAAPEPIHYREVFRTRGPSTRPDLGRQAESN